MGASAQIATFQERGCITGASTKVGMHRGYLRPTPAHGPTVEPHRKGGVVTDGSPSDDAQVDGTCTRGEVHGPSTVNLYPSFRHMHQSINDANGLEELQLKSDRGAARPLLAVRTSACTEH